MVTPLCTHSFSLRRVIPFYPKNELKKIPKTEYYWFSFEQTDITTLRFLLPKLNFRAGTHHIEQRRVARKLFLFRFRKRTFFALGA
jgi:hypothetical protein